VPANHREKVEVGDDRNGVGRLWFRSPPVLVRRINSIPTLAAAQIPGQMEFSAGTAELGVAFGDTRVRPALGWPTMQPIGTILQGGNIQVLRKARHLREQAARSHDLALALK